MATKSTRPAPSHEVGVTFVATYPWGDTYITGIRRALRRLGLKTMDDEFLEGSDACGFFVASDARCIGRGRRLIRAYVEKLESDEISLDDDGPWDALFDALNEAGVYELMHDWKHLDCGADKIVLRSLGVGLSERRIGRDREGNWVYEYKVRGLNLGKAVRGRA